MARDYPRFLYCIAQDSKSPGPFIVHTLFPQLIGRITTKEDGGFQIAPVVTFVQANESVINEVYYQMYDWYERRLMRKANLREDYFIRMSDIASKLASYQYFKSVSISIIYIPSIGSKLEVEKDDWKISITMDDKDTYQSILEKLKKDYQAMYQHTADWPL